MAITVDQDMVDKIAGEDFWEQANISYSIDLENNGSQGESKFNDDVGSGPGYVTISSANTAAIQEAVELWDDLIPNSITQNNVPDAVISINEVYNLPSYYGGVTYSNLHTQVDVHGDYAGVYLRNNPIVIGQYSFTALVHEFGHALGLS